METLIAALRCLCDQGRLVYKMPDIVRIIHMASDDNSFRFN